MLNQYDRLRAKIDKIQKGDNECWIWQWAIGPQGYGSVRYVDKSIGAHRAVYMEYVGKIPRGKLVCHTCDVKPCVNPNHLYIGTHRSNSDDMVERSRSMRGAKNAKTKLTEIQVREILALRGEATSDAVGLLFKVAPTTVRSIWSGYSWGWLTKPLRLERDYFDSVDQDAVTR